MLAFGSQEITNPACQLQKKRPICLMPGCVRVRGADDIVCGADDSIANRCILAVIRVRIVAFWCEFVHQTLCFRSRFVLESLIFRVRSGRYPVAISSPRRTSSTRHATPPPPCSESLGFRVWGFGVRVSGFGFRVPGIGFRVSVIGFEASGIGFRASGFGFWSSDFGSWVAGLGFGVSDFGYGV